MSETRPLDTIAEATERERALRPVARDVVRAWLRDANAGALDRVGHTAIADAADSAAYLAKLGPGLATAPVLDDIERVATALGAPAPPPPRWWSWQRPSAAPALDTDSFARLVERLDHQRDEGARRILTLDTVRNRFAQADRALEDAIHLIRALIPAIDAAVRELRGDDPGRAAALKERADATLLERQQAVLTQWAINRQAVLTIDLLTANQQRLNAALEQARTATLSAVQVAIAARRATADAATPTGDTAAAHRMLSAALEQARSAVLGMDNDASTLDLSPPDALR